MIPVAPLRASLLGLVATLALIACGGSQSPAPATTAPSSSTPASVAHPVADADDAGATAPRESDQADVAGNQEDRAESAGEEAASVATEEVAPAAEPAASREAAEPEQPVAAAIEPPEGPEPRLGVDYTLIDPPQQLASVPGKVEIAEIFSYTCIHCARLDPLIPAWRQTLPEQVNFVHVPMAHGAFEPIARGFYAAQAMGVLEQTHQGMFKALSEQNKLGGGKLDDVARIYASLGVDADALKATANSFAVNTQITRNQRTVARWAIEGTPSLVVAGKYRVVATGDRGHPGMLQAARWLAQRELAAQHAQ